MPHFHKGLRFREAPCLCPPRTRSLHHHSVSALLHQDAQRLVVHCLGVLACLDTPRTLAAASSQESYVGGLGPCSAAPLSTGDLLIAGRVLLRRAVL